MSHPQSPRAARSCKPRSYKICHEAWMNRFVAEHSRGVSSRQSVTRETLLFSRLHLPSPVRKMLHIDAPLALIAIRTLCDDCNWRHRKEISLGRARPAHSGFRRGTAGFDPGKLGGRVCNCLKCNGALVNHSSDVGQRSYRSAPLQLRLDGQELQHRCKNAPTPARIRFAMSFDHVTVRLFGPGESTLT